ncbi:hypothetical protein E2562_036482 [Oryza meyeriana var. granulata]|uniref:Uncharacterized protein n=1 Tax=Oryza meyeriana var. granulata TaxID=110450 RepID=A0A6G1DSK5_9ORYZ|nr:hypothetical protein E2562_036482 [Oryza meyeriana var. granulata]
MYCRNRGNQGQESDAKDPGALRWPWSAPKGFEVPMVRARAIGMDLWDLASTPKVGTWCPEVPKIRASMIGAELGNPIVFQKVLLPGVKRLR